MILNLFIAKRVIVGFFITLLLFAGTSLYFAIDKYDESKRELINSHYSEERIAAQSISEKLLLVDEHITNAAQLLLSFFQSAQISNSEYPTEVFQFTWGQKSPPSLKTSKSNRTNLLLTNYEYIHIVLSYLLKNKNVENSFLIKQINKFDFEYIEQGKEHTPKKILKWLIRHGDYLDFNDKTMIRIPVIGQDGVLVNYFIYPLFQGHADKTTADEEHTEKYYLVSELSPTLLKLPDSLTGNGVIWDPSSGYVIASNLNITSTDTKDSIQKGLIKKELDSKSLGTSNPSLKNKDKSSSILITKKLPPPYDLFTKLKRSNAIKFNETNITKINGNETLLLEQHILGNDYFRMLFAEPIKVLEQQAFMVATKLGLTLFVASTLVLVVFTIIIVWQLAIPISALIISIEGLHFRRETTDNRAAKGWEVWFSLLKQTYRENKDLLSTLSHKTHDLDTKVNQRTQELLDQTSSKDRNLALNRAMMNTIPDMLFYKDMDGQYLGCNSAYEKFIGTSEPNIIHKTSRDLFESNRAQWIENSEQEVIKNKESIIKRRWTRDSNDNVVLILWLYSPIIDNKNQVLGVLGFGRDITLDYNNVHELEKAVAAAEKANAVKGEFIANISHEIRTPMNSIIGMLELLNGINSDPTQKSFIGIADHSAKSLLAVINSVLDFSKGNAHKLKAELGVFNINHVLENAFTNSLPKAMKKGLLLDIELPLNFPQLFISDEIKLTQIFTNLIGNAVKFTHKGRIYVKAELLEKLDSNKQIVKFHVVDTGIGIAKSDRQSVFEAFSQADSSVTREYGGTGLGLAIVYQLVKLLGGEITLESEEGGGTKFSLTFEFDIVTEQPIVEKTQYNFIYWEVDTEISKLFERKLTSIGVVSNPIDLSSESNIKMITEKTVLSPTVLLCRVELIEQLPQGIIDKINSGIIRIQPIAFTLQTCPVLSSLPHLPLLTAPVNAQTMLSNLQQMQIIYPNDPGVRAGKLQGKQILIVEDDEVNQKVLTLILESEGALSSITKNGKEALVELEKQAFDIVITDIQMPVMDGLSLTSRIRLINGLDTLPIIAMSAHSSQMDIDKSLLAGINQHLTKPINKKKLISAVLTFTQPELMLISKQLQQQIDVPFLYTQVNHSLDNMLAILNKFHLSYSSRMNGIINDFESLNAAEKLELLHNFKGAVGNIGAKQIFQLTKELEMQLKSGTVLKHNVNLWQQSVKQLFANLVVVLN